MIRITSKQLSDAYSKSIEKDGFFNVFIYRKISILFVKAFAILGLTPNFVTVSSFIFILVSSVLFSFIDKTIIFLGLIMFNVGVVLDNADGQLAILTNQRTKMGEFLDPFLDKVGGIAILTGLTYSYFRSTGSSTIIYLYVLWVIVYCICLILDNAAERFNISTGIQNLRETQKILPVGIRRYVRWDGGFSAVLTTILVFLGYIPLFIIIDTLITFLPHFFTLVQLVRGLRSK
jgi:phosphatidylglycerophosphate synthase